MSRNRQKNKYKLSLEDGHVMRILLKMYVKNRMNIGGAEKVNHIPRRKARQKLDFLIQKVRSIKIPFLQRKGDLATEIKLDPSIYIEISNIAKKQGTTTSAIIYHAMECYKATNKRGDNQKISLERKDKNPLLLLDGIAESFDQKNIIEKPGGELNESRDTVAG
jgi:hypothetical protein